jgi:ubiquinone/menaquinone biosynthesis C-methylase UbiE
MDRQSPEVTFGGLNTSGESQRERGVATRDDTGSGPVKSTAENARIDFRGNKDRDAESILEWPDRFIGSLKSRLLALNSHSTLSPDDVAELKAYGLVDESTGEPTALGGHLTYLIVHETWQEGGEHNSFGQMGIESFVGSVLEIGCSTGWALRSLGPSLASKRVGVDIDAKALALGYRLSKVEDRDCCFYCCSAHSLPLDNECMGFIICRNSITYLHQHTALREMSRVLKSKGLIFIRFENIWYDLWRLRHSKSVASFCFSLRDFLLALIPAAFGWEPRLGSVFRGGRAFSSRRRLKRLLEDCGCEIIRIDDSLRCPRFLGFSTQTSMLARKVGKA